MSKFLDNINVVGTGLFQADVLGSLGVTVSNLNGTVGNSGAYFALDSNAIAQATWNGVVGLTSSGQDSRDFLLYNPSTTAKYLFSKDGFLGIGNTAPAYKLHVTGDSGFNAAMLLQATSTNDRGYIQVASDSAYNYMMAFGSTYPGSPGDAYAIANATAFIGSGGAGSSTWLVDGGGSNEINFAVGTPGATPKLMSLRNVAGSGALGIGTALGDRGIHVRTNNAGLASIQAEQLSTSEEAYIEVSVAGDNGLIEQYGSTWVPGTHAYRVASATSFVGSSGGTWVANPWGAGIHFAVGNPSVTDEVVTIAGNGWLGLNNNSPSARLHVVASTGYDAAIIKGGGTTSATYGLKVHDSTGSSNSLIVRDDGFVGLGTSSPASTLEIFKSTNPFLNIHAGNNGTFGISFSRNGVYDDPARILYSGGGLFFTPAPSSPVFRINPYASADATTPSTGYQLEVIVDSSKLLNLKPINATAGTQLVDSAALMFGSTYWDGASERNDFRIFVNQIDTAGLAVLKIGTSLNGGAVTNRVSLTNTGSLGVGTVLPDTSSVVDITSTTRGMLVPRMTTSQRDLISSPVESLLIYNTTLSKFQYYTSAISPDGWETIESSIAGGVNKYATTLTGIVADTPITVTHALGNTDIMVQLWDLTSGEMIFAKLDNRTTNTVDVTFVGSAPAGNVRTVVLA